MTPAPLGQCSHHLLNIWKGEVSAEIISVFPLMLELNIAGEEVRPFGKKTNKHLSFLSTCTHTKTQYPNPIPTVMVCSSCTNGSPLTCTLNSGFRTIPIKVNTCK